MSLKDSPLARRRMIFARNTFRASRVRLRAILDRNQAYGGNSAQGNGDFHALKGAVDDPGRVHAEFLDRVRLLLGLHDTHLNIKVGTWRKIARNTPGTSGLDRWIRPGRSGRSRHKQP